MPELEQARVIYRARLVELADAVAEEKATLALWENRQKATVAARQAAHDASEALLRIARGDIPYESLY